VDPRQTGKVRPTLEVIPPKSKKLKVDKAKPGSDVVRFWWKCKTCGATGVIALPGRSRSDRLITGMEEQHKRASPDCPKTRGQIQDEFWGEKGTLRIE